MGWFAVADMSQEGETLHYYAAWQDYKRRGFYIQRQGEDEYHPVAGSTLEELLAGVEFNHREFHAMDITYTLTEAEVKQACRNFIVDRTKVKPEDITHVGIHVTKGDRPGESDSLSATVRVSGHQAKVD